MGSGTFYPAASGDDGYRSSSINLTAGVATFGNVGASCHAFIRFVDVTIPQGSIITTAYIHFTAGTSDSGTAVNTNIYFNDIDDAIAPTDGSEFDALVKTTEFTVWDGVGGWTNGTQYDTPSLVDVLQEIVDRGGFSSGNAAMALIYDDGSDSSAARSFRSFDQLGGISKAELYVEWTASDVTPDEVNQLQTVDSLTLTQKHSLTVHEDSHLQLADGDLILVVNLLKNVSADQLQIPDGSLSITQKHLLALQSSSHYQTVDSPLSITQKHLLVIQESNQLLDTANVGSLFILSVQDINQLQTSANISVNLILAPTDPNQLQVIEDIGLTQKHDIVVQESGQIHAVDTFYLEWPDWLSVYGVQAAKNYFFTLTGDADSLSDLVLPMSSFQARRRSGEPTYLSVVIPGTTYKSDIESRSNGQMVITCRYTLVGQDARDAEIMRVDYEEVREDEGGRNQSLTLTGRITESFVSKTVTLLDATYKRDNDGDLNYRCNTVDPFLNPGDTAEYGGDSFTVGLITISVSVEAQSMEVAEVDI